MPTLDAKGLRLSRDGEPLLVDATLDAPGGAYTCVLGPSGAGKTTILRVLAGLERLDAGLVTLDGAPLDARPERRPFGVVFQELALFPTMDVLANVGYGLRVRGLAKVEARRRAEESLALVGLSAFGSRRIGDLSGGERQRVALARALAPEPAALLLDEPLSSLDRALREELRRELAALQRRLGVTVVHVTHDQEEALALAHRLHVMNAGRVVESGSPRDLLARPRTAFTARFLALGAVLDEAAAARLGGPAPEPGRAWLVRPRHVALASGGLPALVREVVPRVERDLVTVACNGTLFTAQAREGRLAVGDATTVTVEWSVVDTVAA